VKKEQSEVRMSLAQITVTTTTAEVAWKRDWRMPQRISCLISRERVVEIDPEKGGDDKEKKRQEVPLWLQFGILMSFNMRGSSMGFFCLSGFVTGTKHAPWLVTTPYTDLLVAPGGYRRMAFQIGMITLFHWRLLHCWHVSYATIPYWTDPYLPSFSHQHCAQACRVP
jgi:hypothetical protein